MHIRLKTALCLKKQQQQQQENKDNKKNYSAVITKYWPLNNLLCSGVGRGWVRVDDLTETRAMEFVWGADVRESFPQQL